MGPPPPKRQPKESFPNGHQPQRRTSPRPNSNSGNGDASRLRPSAPESKPAQSFKERLFARPKKREPTPEPPMIELHSRPQTTIAPFFQKIQAAFGEETQPSRQNKRQRHQDTKQATVHPPTLPHKRHSTVQSRKRKRESPVIAQEDSLSSEAEDMLDELRTHYLTAATTLHSHALTSLTKAHTFLIEKLDTDIVGSDEDFLQHAEKRARKLAAPLSGFTIRSEQRGSDGVMRVEKHVIGDLVESAEKKLADTERELEGLWREYVESEEGLERVWEEVSKEIEEMKSGKGRKKKEEGGKKGVQGSGLDNREGEENLAEMGANDDDGKEAKSEDGLDEQEVLAKYEEAIQEEIEKAEEEVTELTSLTYQMMKDLEKDYRKAIIPDLHLFYTSIEDV
ncbi:hypothetical protein B0T20DRAFT_362378 [Sordaria brevicollis]|uniref:Uncharacterized protein n=1 Tax=Sordaria brevicollis TaxID=83679 RepID=A0AAE0P2C1_SORBR|nr:hypothetical protein B0T20DRAFT_362378 [Sordaria brevicollis]